MRILACLILSAALASPQEAPVFRIGTRLVELQVVVTGKDGKPVAGLTEDDFTVLENGKEQKLAFFSTAADPAPAAGEALPPGVFSNRPEYAPAPPRNVTVILLDWLNTDVRDQLYAKAEVAKYLKDMNPRDQVALYELGGAISIAHDFTDDPAALAKRVEKMRANWPPANLGEEQTLKTLAELVEDLLSVRADGTKSEVLDSRSEAANFSKEIRVTNTLRQFELLAQRMAGIQGRKNLVWVSGGIPLLATWQTMAVSGAIGPGLRTFAAQFDRAVRALTDANVSVYTIDARGLRMDTDSPAMATAAANRPGFAGAQAAGMRDSMAADTLSSIQGLAEETGGRVFRNMNELSAGIRLAAEDAASSYMLAYYTPEDRNSKPRKLEVKVKRKDAVLHVRRSFTPAALQSAITAVELLQSPVPATGLLLNAQVVRTGGGSFRATVQLDATGLSLRQEKGEVRGAIELYYALIPPDGKAKTTNAKVSLNLKDDQFQQVLRNGLVLPKDIAGPANATRLRILVRDAESGAAGSLDVPVRAVPESN